MAFCDVNYGFAPVCEATNQVRYGGVQRTEVLDLCINKCFDNCYLGFPVFP